MGFRNLIERRKNVINIVDSGLYEVYHVCQPMHPVS